MIVIKHTKPSGWIDGGYVWHPPAKARGGQRYKCKTCGRTGSGYGGYLRDRSDECSTMDVERAHNARLDAEKTQRANEAREYMRGVDWTSMNDEDVIRIKASAANLVRGAAQLKAMES